MRNDTSEVPEKRHQVFNWKSFALGFAAAALLFIGGGIWLLRKIDENNANIIMPPKTFFDAAETAPLRDGYIAFSGSLGGKEPIGAPSNIFYAECHQKRMVCDTIDIRQIGHNQMGELNKDSYSITKWTPDLVEAESSSPLCVTVTLVIRRKSKVVEYIRASKENVSAEFCKSVEKRTIVWTLEDSPFWRKLSSGAG